MADLPNMTIFKSQLICSGLQYEKIQEFRYKCLNTFIKKYVQAESEQTGACPNLE